jgi:hypothetical protein
LEHWLVILSDEVYTILMLCMAEFYRFCNFHGEQHARLNIETSIHSEGPKYPQLLALISPFLFYAPDAYYKELHKIFVDGMVVGHRWQEFIGKLTEEWQSFLLLV